MEQYDQPDLRPLAWNGVWLQTPADWEPVTLEKHYLRAAGSGRLAVECKWQEGRSVSNKKALSRLRKAVGDADLQLDAARMPQALQPAFAALAEKGLDVTPFSWRLDATQGVGALLFCPQCRRSTLLQCSGSEVDHELCARILGSFCDHAPDGGKEYRLFGIAAKVPSGFTLRHFSFKPGQYRLEFAGGKERKRVGIVLERVGPANVLFETGDFYAWAVQRFAVTGAKDKPEASAWQGGAAVDWNPRLEGVQRLLAAISRRHRPPYIRAWQPEGANTVLCVLMTGGSKGARELFEEVCTHYVLA